LSRVLREVDHAGTTIDIPVGVNAALLIKCHSLTIIQCPKTIFSGFSEVLWFYFLMLQQFLFMVKQLNGHPEKRIR